jgi:PBP1b-binding outer membrane lipoprotein LpoB
MKFCDSLLSPLALPVSRFLIPISRLLCALCLLCGSLWLAGCNGPAISSHAYNTFLDSDDLIRMTDQMAASISSDPVIAKITAQGPMVIVLSTLKNTTSQIILTSQGDIFLHRLRALLTAQPSLRSRFVFVLDPAAFQRLLSQEGIPASQLGPQEDRLQPQYALQAVFYSDTNVSSQYRSDYYLCTFFLTNIITGQIVWEGSYETKKAQKNGFLD